MKLWFLELTSSSGSAYSLAARSRAGWLYAEHDTVCRGPFLHEQYINVLIAWVIVGEV